MTAPHNEEAPDTACNGPGLGGMGECSGRYSEAPAQPLPSIRSPRQRRVLLALLTGPQTREQLDRIAGASNAPDVVLRLRRRFGLSLPCELLRVRDRDGRTVEPGRYSLTEADKAQALRIVQPQGGAA